MGNSRHYSNNFINNYGHGVVIQGDHNRVEQIDLRPRYKRVKSFLNDLKVAMPELDLSDEDREQLWSQLLMIKTLLEKNSSTSEQPGLDKQRNQIVAESLQTIRNILENITGSILVAPLLRQLSTLLPLFM